MSAAFLSGCTTGKTPRGAPRLPGVREYREITAESRTAVQAALESIDQVAAESWPCPPRVLATFSDRVHHLEVRSIKVRARVQAIQARGDEYFADWSRAITQIEDPRVRALAERHHPELEQSYNRIKAASQQARETFRLFLGNLRTLRTQSENSSRGAETPTDLIRDLRDQGEKLLGILDAISSELQAITARLTPVKTAAKQ